MNNVRKFAAGATLIGALVGGGALTATALPANAATTAPSPSNTATPDGSHSDETPLTGDTATKVQDAVLAANAGATIDRMETEGDGSAVYEAHITKTDGTLIFLQT